jgi:hypothetical protein
MKKREKPERHSNSGRAIKQLAVGPLPRWRLGCNPSCASVALGKNTRSYLKNK